MYVEIVKNSSKGKGELLPIIEGKILEGSRIHTDGWRAYDGLLLNGYAPYRVFDGQNEFARGKWHINGLEIFWRYTKRRLSQCNGLSSQRFFLHLQESAFRFKNREKDLYQLFLKKLRQSPL